MKELSNYSRVSRERQDPPGRDLMNCLSHRGSAPIDAERRRWPCQGRSEDWGGSSFSENSVINMFLFVCHNTLLPRVGYSTDHIVASPRSNEIDKWDERTFQLLQRFPKKTRSPRGDSMNCLSKSTAAQSGLFHRPHRSKPEVQLNQ